MADKLLVRMYDVGVGDCIYVCIPKKDGTSFHILIDCGSKGSAGLLEKAISNLEKSLPMDEDNSGKKRLDLLIVTHEHQDHIKGFDPDYFKNINIKNTWLSAAMDNDHPQAQASLKLHQDAETNMQQIAKMGFALSDEYQELVDTFSIGNAGAKKSIKEEFGTPDYVHTKWRSKTRKLGLKKEDAELKILGPHNDIDGYYLGKEFDETLHAMNGFRTFFNPDSNTSDQIPSNISNSDFRLLQSRMLSNSFAFAELASRVKNNASVVLLIKWEGRRLLFVGDAEWEHTYKAGKRNGGWNVMWHKQKAELDNPIDFLKIGHHGSTNSTPWGEGHSTDNEPSKILDAILPLANKDNAKAIVSTLRSNYKTIPNAELLTEIGKRVSNTRNYFEELSNQAGIEPSDLARYDQYEKDWLNQAQPWRTDIEKLLTGAEFVDITFEPVT